MVSKLPIICEQTVARTDASVHGSVILTGLKTKTLLAERDSSSFGDLFLPFPPSSFGDLFLPFPPPNFCSAENRTNRSSKVEASSQTALRNTEGEGRAREVEPEAPHLFLRALVP